MLKMLLVQKLKSLPLSCPSFHLPNIKPHEILCRLDSINYIPGIILREAPTPLGSVPLSNRLLPQKCRNWNIRKVQPPVALLNILVFRDVPRGLVLYIAIDDSKDRRAFIFRVKQSKNTGLLDPVDKGTTIFRNVGNYQQTRRNVTAESSDISFVT
jgi:hypothetical protein